MLTVLNALVAASVVSSALNQHLVASDTPLKPFNLADQLPDAGERQLLAANPTATGLFASFGTPKEELFATFWLQKVEDTTQLSLKSTTSADKEAGT